VRASAIAPDGFQEAAATVIAAGVSSAAAVSGATGTLTCTHLVAASGSGSAPSAQVSVVVQLSNSASSPLLVTLSFELDSSDDVVGAVFAVLSEDDNSGVGVSTFVLVDAVVLAAGVCSASVSESDWDDSFGVSGFTVFLVDGRLILVGVFSFCLRRANLSTWSLSRLRLVSYLLLLMLFLLRCGRLGAMTAYC
jgi:hypothetical protein